MRVVVLLFLFLMGSFSWRAYERFWPGTLRILFFDVGQGDSILVRFPKGAVWLIDAGGGSAKWNWGRELFLELTRMGVLTLDVALLTHPDQDHALGFVGLFDQLTVRDFWWNGHLAPGSEPLLDRLKAQAKDRGIRSLPQGTPQQRQVEGVHVHTLPLRRGTSSNDRSLAVSIEWSGCRFLMAGDAEAAGEKELLARGIGAHHVLKVNHHGSKTSSLPEFIAKVSPRWAVFSAGEGNRYGHPAPSIVHRFSGRQILRTDFHGYAEFTVRSDRTLSCHSARGPCGKVRCE